jgi:hypothetical protein
MQSTFKNKKQLKVEYALPLNENAEYSEIKYSKTIPMKITRKIRFTLLAFVILLVLSGLTAFPVRSELVFLLQHKSFFRQFMQTWISSLVQVIDSTPEIVLYGTDWLAFAHIIIALFFIPVYLDPVKHKSNVIIGLCACMAVFPLAFICGPIRGIPFFHQLIDCCFGVGGAIFLYTVYNNISRLEKLQYESTR